MQVVSIDFETYSEGDIRFITGGRVNFIHPITKADIKGCPTGTCVIVFDPFYKGSQPKITTLDRNGLRTFGEEILTKKEAA